MYADVGHWLVRWYLRNAFDAVCVHGRHWIGPNARLCLLRRSCGPSDGCHWVLAKDSLLDAADRLFYREGVLAVGIDRVLAEADAAKASLYQHFGCKDQLVASYLERRTVDARASIEAYLADTPPSQRALKFFDWVVEWAESKDFRGCPLQHTVTELTDAAHPARVIAHGQREWFAERFLEWTKAARVKDPKATARALVVLFDGAVAGSEVDGPHRASDARWMARKLLAG